MEPDQINDILTQKLTDCKVYVEGDGRHFEAIIIGDIFQNKSRIERQRLVYSVLDDYLKSGALHAITLKTYTPAQWQELKHTGGC